MTPKPEPAHNEVAQVTPDPAENLPGGKQRAQVMAGHPSEVEDPGSPFKSVVTPEQTAMPDQKGGKDSTEASESQESLAVGNMEAEPGEAISNSNDAPRGAETVTSEPGTEEAVGKEQGQGSLMGSDDDKDKELGISQGSKGNEGLANADSSPRETNLPQESAMIQEVLDPQSASPEQMSQSRRTLQLLPLRQRKLQDLAGPTMERLSFQHNFSHLSRRCSSHMGYPKILNLVMPAPQKVQHGANRISSRGHKGAIQLPTTMITVGLIRM